jgi:hypothetical protein
MYYKPDWEATQERLLAWWNHEVIDRCCIAVHAPKDGSTIPPAPDLQHGPWLYGMDAMADDDTQAIERWWKDPELNHQRAITWFDNTYFAGEALPVTYVNWGAMALAAIFGSPPEFNKASVWYPKIIDDWNQWTWTLDKDANPTWQTLLAIVDRLTEGAEGKYLVGKPELGNGADVLSLMRGMDHLAMDLIMNPEAVKTGVEVISDAWVTLMEQAYQRTTASNHGGDVLAWMGIWAPGRTDQIACDFSTVISPQMFEEFFIPEILKMGNWCEYGVYHLDGQSCMMNMLDILLEIDQIKTIQFTPGTGSPLPTYSEQYIPRYRRILESGKNLYLLVQPDEVAPILAELPPEGLFMRTYVNSEEEADDMLKNVDKWSGRGNQFPVA